MDDYTWEMTRGQVRRVPFKVPKRKAAGRVLMRFGLMLVGVLLISTAYQYVIWMSGPAIMMDFIHSMVTSPDEVSEEQTKQYLRERMGFDGPFVPDLWPFDNESLWHSE